MSVVSVLKVEVNTVKCGKYLQPQKHRIVKYIYNICQKLTVELSSIIIIGNVDPYRNIKVVHTFHCLGFESKQSNKNMYPTASVCADYATIPKYALHLRQVYLCMLSTDNWIDSNKYTKIIRHSTYTSYQPHFHANGKNMKLGRHSAHCKCTHRNLVENSSESRDSSLKQNLQLGKRMDTFRKM